MKEQRRRSGKLPIVLSVTALLIAVLGFTPLGEAAKKLVIPKNSIGSNQIKAGGVKLGDLAANSVDASKLADNAVGSGEIANSAITSGDIAPGVIPAAFSGAAAGGDLAGTYPNPTIKDGAVTAAKHAVTPTVRAAHSANQAIVNNAFATVALDTEIFDSATLHDNATNNSRITITTAGVYLVGANITWAPNATGARELNMRKNGATIVGRVVQLEAGINSVDQELTTLVKLAAGDFLEIAVRQTSGANLDILTTSPGPNEFTPIMWATWIGPAPA